MTLKWPKQFVYFFSAERTDGRADMKSLLGGKGANLAEMCLLKLPVPPGFTISTEICQLFYDAGGVLPPEVKEEVLKNLTTVEGLLGKRFGDPQNPLLLSVRSGARASMPGMMDTILNLGLNDQTVLGLAKISQNERFAWDSYRRFIQMYSNVVMGMNASLLEILIEDLKAEKGIENDTDLSAQDLTCLVGQFKKQISQATGRNFPSDPREQLWEAISAVFRSWNSNRAITYRQLHGIPADWGTAVNVQSMVFGNLGEDSATGVAFTRNPSTGEKQRYGEYLLNAQGEDVVAGIRTPLPLAPHSDHPALSLKEKMPIIYGELEKVFELLESHYKDMQDIEFTVERNRLWMLQTRTGKRTARASLRIAVDMISEKLITEKDALLRIDPLSLDQLLHPRLDPQAKKELLARGLPASPGGVSGEIVFTNEDAVTRSQKGHKVILVRVETSPEDIEGMVSAQGILTTRGGMTSHAAVVARGMGKCCVAGCSEVFVDENQRELRAKGYLLREGDKITLDGSTGEVFLGEVPTIEPSLDHYFDEIMKLSDRYRRLEVRTNADSAKDATLARRFGAKGIGLCRTEHMFFGADRIDVVRQMILAENRDERSRALDRLLPMQREDFFEIFKSMSGLPVTIRLLDPPLHEFLPHTEADIAELAQRIEYEEERLRQLVKNLHEFNPMLGHRGCRLGITFPEIYVMQARAIAEAAAMAIKENLKVLPEIMIPLVAVEEELTWLRRKVLEEVKAVQTETKVDFEFLIGTMIELPRAALTADEIARQADFFSFGTNDLTQTTLGISRDDSSRFLSTYVSEGFLPSDPFATVDRKGVGKLIQIGVELGRKTQPNLKIGVCGEHGGDPASIEFFHSVGLDYVSCSPYRVPVARLATARAALKN